MDQYERILKTMKERDTFLKMREYQDSYDEIQYQRGVQIKINGSLTNIHKECEVLEEKYALRDETTRKHRVLNTYVHNFQNMLCLNQRSKEALDPHDPISKSKDGFTLTVDFIEFNALRQLAQGTGYDENAQAKKFRN
jgi:hypothetical protein